MPASSRVKHKLDDVTHYSLVEILHNSAITERNFPAKIFLRLATGNGGNSDSYRLVFEELSVIWNFHASKFLKERKIDTEVS